MSRVYHRLKHLALSYRDRLACCRPAVQLQGYPQARIGGRPLERGEALDRVGRGRSLPSGELRAGRSSPGGPATGRERIGMGDPPGYELA